MFRESFIPKLKVPKNLFYWGKRQFCYDFETESSEKVKEFYDYNVINFALLSRR